MNKLSLRELEQIEQLAHRSGTAEAGVVLRLAAALREALQEKENAVAIPLTLNVRNVNGPMEYADATAPTEPSRLRVFLRAVGTTPVD